MRTLLKCFVVLCAVLKPGQSISTTLFSSNVSFTDCEDLNATEWCFKNKNISSDKDLKSCYEDKGCCPAPFNSTLTNYTTCTSEPLFPLISQFFGIEAGFAFLGTCVGIVACYGGDITPLIGSIILFFWGSSIFGAIGTGLSYLTRTHEGVISLSVIGMMGGPLCVFAQRKLCKKRQEPALPAPVQLALPMPTPRQAWV